ncbi:MAG TPA: ATP-binding protein [Candidatus Goldiibacteriota bacterium]|nr:ATP-binding protein [Candidatus Goldiibacteriota bacterium]HPI03210.1 ATP-binding protein [Candidatus Goldiibacteriota bacterium]HRQ43528.1 ATP-binding protein [Candidatus Goldiibacteriota bacterium]
MEKMAEINTALLQLKKNTAESAIIADANVHNLAFIRRWISSAMKKQGFAPDDISPIKVSVTEHCENIIKHAYADKPGKVEIIIRLDYPRAGITVVDSGPAFDMTGYKPRDISKRIKEGIGGNMGIKTIMTLCTEVKYRRVKNRNENTFIIKAKKTGKVKK